MHFSGSRALLRKAWRLQYGIKPQPRSDSSTAQRTPASSHNQATSRAFPSTFPKVSQPLRRTITKPSSSGKLQTKRRCALPNYFGGNSMATMSTMSSHTIEPADPPLHRQPPWRPSCFACQQKRLKLWDLPWTQGCRSQAFQRSYCKLMPLILLCVRLVRGFQSQLQHPKSTAKQMCKRRFSYGAQRSRYRRYRHKEFPPCGTLGSLGHLAMIIPSLNLDLAGAQV